MASDDFSIKVLLVDDQAIVGETVRQMLAAEPDIEYRFCPDPAAAIDVANEFQPTVILQDLVMPDIDGLQLVKFYRANAGTRDTPLVVLSSKEEPVIKAQAFALGANDYMVKLPDKLEVDRPRALPLARLHQPAGAERGVPRAGREAARTGRRGEPRRAVRAVAAARAAHVRPVHDRLEVRAVHATRRRHVRLPLDRQEAPRGLPARRERPRRRLGAAGGVGRERPVGRRACRASIRATRGR